MIRFTTPCFVRVENPQERKELKQWLKDMGYGISGASNSSQITTCPRSGQAYFGLWSNTEAIKCDSIPLFKALAAMNGENDREQWFVGMYESDYDTWYLCHRDHLGTFAKNGMPLRKANSEEIINHFKK